MDRDLAAGFDLFRTIRDESDDSSFKEESNGLRLRAGYELGQIFGSLWIISLRQLRSVMLM